MTIEDKFNKLVEQQEGTELSVSDFLIPFYGMYSGLKKISNREYKTNKLNSKNAVAFGTYSIIYNLAAIEGANYIKEIAMQYI